MHEDNHPEHAKRIDQNLLSRPVYSLAMASRLVGLSQPRVARWLKGYSYVYTPAASHEAVRRTQRPVIRASATNEASYVSFQQVIDLLFVKAFLNEGISLQSLRQALKEAESILGRPSFAYKEFWTSGKGIYLQVQNHEGALLHLLSGGQWSIGDIVRETGHQLDFNRTTGITERWFPLGREIPIVLDPRICFGAPTVYRRGILTANVYDLYLAEGKNGKEVCTWFDLDRSEVDAAVKYQSMLIAA